MKPDKFKESISIHRLGGDWKESIIFYKEKGEIMVTNNLFEGNIYEFSDFVKKAYGGGEGDNIPLSRGGVQFMLAIGLAILELTEHDEDYSRPYVEKLMEFVNDGSFKALIDKFSPDLVFGNSAPYDRYHDYLERMHLEYLKFIDPRI